MTQQEFEEFAGYKVRGADYVRYIEPMYDAVAASKRAFAAMVSRERFEIRGLTEGERDIMEAFGARFATRNSRAGATQSEPPTIDLWAESPCFDEREIDRVWHGGGWLAQANADFFPSVRPGDCWGMDNGDEDCCSCSCSGNGEG